MAKLTPRKLNALIKERDEIVAWMETARARELELRKAICKALVPKPKEGTNKGVHDGREFVYTNKINVDIDMAALPAVLKKLPKGTEDLCVNYNPKLIKAGYKGLPKHLQKIFDQALIRKPGTPQLTMLSKDETE